MENIAFPNAPGIYAIVNTVSGKRYIGQTANIKKRRREHMGGIMRGNHNSRVIRRAVAKYGPQAFVFTLVELCAIEALNEREQFWLSHYGKPNLYNQSMLSGPPRGWKMPDEARQKLIERNRTRVFTQEMRKNMSDAQKGKKLPQWHIDILRNLHTGRKQSAEQIRKSAEGRRGGKRSDETRAKLREAGRRQKGRPGHPCSEEVKQKLREHNLGKRHTPEAKLKMSLAHKGKKQSPEWIKRRVESNIRNRLQATAHG